jgi:hypothetical protein
MKYFYETGDSYDNALSNSIDGLNYELKEYYDEGWRVERTIYGYIANSGMTDVSLAIVSDKKSDIESINSKEIDKWLEEGANAEENGVDWDWTTFNGLPIETDENGSLCEFDEGYMFDEPLLTLIPKIKEEYGELSNDELESILTSEYGERVGRTYLLDDNASVYPNSLIVSPKYESWRF